MKKVIFVLVAVSTILIACSNVSNSPKATVQKFYQTLEKQDYKTMGTIATPETIQLVTMFGPKLQGMVASYGKVESMEEIIDGDTAVVTGKFQNGEEMSIDLIKIDGKWKVSMSMDK
ncbi:MAG: DUF4878 domain-containing protein [Synergistaceae bacterium]|jgi:hypothetical protein|nr:DUF4878 domain-containing protein [Synergistaceae bacterium]